ncbi:MAG TPA: hypothetical protein VFT01_06230 [Homoserinimonas sp.]|nr:hypothetical protein [Homoserinimonas sp.]
MTRHLAAGALLVAFLTSCGGETGPSGIDVGTIVVAPNPIVVMQQQTAQLAVSVLDPSGALLAGVPVTFTSGDADIATVSNVGLVTSVGPAGQTSVSVKAGNKTMAVPVTVTATSNSIVIGPSASTMPQMGTLQLQPELLDLEGTPIAGAEFTYETTNPAIATVGADGLVTSNGPAGLVTVTVRSGDIMGVKALSITQVATSIRLTPAVVTMAKGSSLQFAAAVLDAIGQPMSGSTGPVTYSASPSTLLTISGAGFLTATDQAGSGSVTATSGALSGSAAVSVVDLGSLTGTVLHHISAGSQAYGVAVSSAGDIFGVSVQGLLYRGNLASSSMESSRISDLVTIGVAVNNGGDRVYVAGAGADGLIEADAATGARLRTWDAGGEQLYDVVLSPSGQTIYVAGETGTIYPIDATTLVSGPVIISDGNSIVHLAHHPVEPLIFASGAGHAREINTETGASRTFAVGPAAQASALALAGDRLFVAGENGKLDVISLGTGEVTTVTIPECSMYDIVATPGGEALLATCAFGGTVKLIDPESATALITIPVGGDPRRAAISADGSRAVVANQSGWFDIIQ